MPWLLHCFPPIGIMVGFPGVVAPDFDCGCNLRWIPPGLMHRQTEPSSPGPCGTFGVNSSQPGRASLGDLQLGIWSKARFAGAQRGRVTFPRSHSTRPHFPSWLSSPSLGFCPQSPTFTRLEWGVWREEGRLTSLGSILLPPRVYMFLLLHPPHAPPSCWQPSWRECGKFYTRADREKLV